MSEYLPPPGGVIRHGEITIAKRYKCVPRGTMVIIEDVEDAAGDRRVIDKDGNEGRIVIPAGARTPNDVLQRSTIVAIGPDVHGLAEGDLVHCPLSAGRRYAGQRRLVSDADIVMRFEEE